MSIQLRDEPVSTIQIGSGAYFDDAQIAIIKDTICKGSTDSELQFFLQVCKRTGLDPFSRQIYSIPRGGQRTIQVGIDGLCLIADRTGKYMPGKESVFAYTSTGAIYSCTAYIKKQARDGSWHEVSAIAFWDEYNAGQGLWKKMPRRMLEKCALALCLRKAFPSDLSGLYTHEEMEQADVKPLYMTNEQKPFVKKITITQEQADELAEISLATDPEIAKKAWARCVKLGFERWEDLTPEVYANCKNYMLANPKKTESPRSMDEVAQEEFAQEKSVFEGAE